MNGCVADKKLFDRLCELKSAVFSLLAVTDFAVLLRIDDDSRNCIVVYIVGNAGNTISQLRESLSDDLLPNNYDLVMVAVDNIPFTQDGKVNLAELLALPVVEPPHVGIWEHAIRKDCKVQEVVATITTIRPLVPRIHMGELYDSVPVQPADHVAADIHPEYAHTPVSREDIKPLAISCGELLLADWQPLNLSQVLDHAADNSPRHGVRYLQDDGGEVFESYADLRDKASRIAGSLRAYGLAGACNVIFQLDNNQHFIWALWGCLLGGVVPVPMAAAAAYEPTDNIVRGIAHSWKLFDRPIVLTCRQRQEAIERVGRVLALADFRVVVIEDLVEAQPLPPGDRPSPEADAVAMLLLTSGSTGIPKGVPLTHRNLLHSIRATAIAGDFGGDDVSLNWLPLDHPGPMIRCVLRPTLFGAEQIHASPAIFLRDPLQWLDWIEKFRVTHAWAPNFAFALLSDNAARVRRHHWDLSCLKSLLNTAEPIVPATAQAVLDLLRGYGVQPETMHASWGMAETSSGVTQSSRFLAGSPILQGHSFANLGKPVAGVSLRIVDERDQPLQECEIGHLQVRGATVIHGYYKNPGLNAEMFTPDGWLRTGDLGFLDQGALVITGRSKDLIIVNGRNCYSHEIESAVEEIEGVDVSYTAACGVRAAGDDTDRLAIFLHTSIEEDDELRELLASVRRNVTRKTGVYPSHLLPLPKERIPKTSIGKIQRSRLKQAFEAGEFHALARRMDLLLATENTLPQWFFKKTWQRREFDPGPGPDPLSGSCLVFADRLGLGAYLASTIRARGGRCYLVYAGKSNIEPDEDTAILRPTNRNDYILLVRRLKARGRWPATVFHLWHVDIDESAIASMPAIENAQNLGVFSVLLLLQSLAAERTEGMSGLRLAVAAQWAQPRDDSARHEPGKSTVLGLVKSATRELPWLDAFHIDLELSADDFEPAVRQLVAEFDSPRREAEVVYRSGQRFVARLAPAELTRPRAKAPPELKMNGVYLITGGLGGIGFELARHLLSVWQARLVLLGRRPLADNEARSVLLRELRSLPGEVVYEAVDLSDHGTLEQVVERNERHFAAPVDGIFHLAGVAPERPLREQTIAQLQEVFAPKLYGLVGIARLLDRYPQAFLVAMSSVVSFFGGATMAGYAAANNFAESFITHLRHTRGRKAWYLSSSTWQDTGMSKGYHGSSATRAQGHYAMTVREGLVSLFGMMNHDQGSLLVGLDGSSTHVAPWTTLPARATEQLSAVYSTADGTALAHHCFSRCRINDRFGNALPYRVRWLKRLPQTASGHLDRVAAIALAEGRDSIREATSDSERMLLQLWKNILCRSRIDVRDNFFELGGNSLMALSLVAEIRNIHGRDIPVTALFEAPTIEQLARWLDADLKPLQTTHPVVPLRPGAGSPGFFLIHDADGNVFLYHNLVQRLPARLAAYGLLPCSADGIPIVHTRIADMVGWYADRIVETQPEGPYILGGLCAGGVLAFETAAELTARGYQVLMVVLLDALAAHASSRRARVERRQRLQHFIHALRGRRVVAAVNVAARKVSNLSNFVITDRLQRHREQRRIEEFRRLSDAGRPLPQWLHGISVRQMYRFAKADFKPRRFDGRVVLIRATRQLADSRPGFDDMPSRLLSDDPQFGWGALAPRGVSSYDVYGGHSSMLQEPHVAGIARILEQEIASLQVDDVLNQAVVE